MSEGPQALETTPRVRTHPPSALQKLNEPNLLQKLVTDESLTRRTKNFETLTSDQFSNFPKWTVEQFRKFSGTYQLCLARSNTADHFDAGKNEYLMCEDQLTPDFAKYGL